MRIRIRNTVDYSKPIEGHRIRIQNTRYWGDLLEKSTQYTPCSCWAGGCVMPPGSDPWTRTGTWRLRQGALALSSQGSPGRRCVGRWQQAASAVRAIFRRWHWYHPPGSSCCCCHDSDTTAAACIPLLLLATAPLHAGSAVVVAHVALPAAAACWECPSPGGNGLAPIYHRWRTRQS